MRETFLPFSKPSITQSEIDALNAVLRSGWITTGPKNAEFEEKFKAYTGCQAAVAMTSETSVMQALLRALGIGPGDEVITPSMTWVSLPNTVCLCGAKPVFVDCDRDTLMVTPEAVEAAITPRTKLIVPVHFAGAPFDVAGFRRMAQKHAIPLVEDAAHALGTEFILPTHSLKHSIPRLPAGNGGLVDRTTEKLKWNRYTQTTTQKTAQTTAFDDSWRWNLVYQSRSGRPAQPWSEPSIGDFLRQIRGVFPEIRNILVVPIGFFFENMETVGDLDKDFAEICAENGVRYWRAEAVGNTFQAVCLAANLLTEGPNDAFCADFNDSKEEFGRIGACSTCELRCKSEKK